MSGDTLCLLCHRPFVRPDVDPWVPSQLGPDVGICPSCRADAALGRAVRAMPIFWQLCHGTAGWQADDDEKIGRGHTPEAALRAAGLMEEEK